MYVIVPNTVHSLNVGRMGRYVRFAFAVNWFGIVDRCSVHAHIRQWTMMKTEPSMRTCERWLHWLLCESFAVCPLAYDIVMTHSGRSNGDNNQSTSPSLSHHLSFHLWCAVDFVYYMLTMLPFTNNNVDFWWHAIYRKTFACLLMASACGILVHRKPHGRTYQQPTAYKIYKQVI